jgi:acylphosphatase
METKDVRGFSVHGHVQGVGFRWWARAHALRESLGGTVRNRPDGTVEVWLRGDPDRIAAFRTRLEHGPPGSEVSTVAPLEVPPPPLPPHGFEILG